MMSSDVFRHVALSDEHAALLTKISGDVAILADICRADLTIFCRVNAAQVVAIAHASPHSASPVFRNISLGERGGSPEYSEVLRAFSGRRIAPSTVRTEQVRGASIARQFFPVRDEQRRLIAVMAKDAYWLAYERHRRRSRVFQAALDDFCAMVLAGRLVGAEALGSFGEHDGIVYVGADRTVQYMSGIATEMYNQLGFRDNLLGRQIDEIGTIDHQLVSQAVHDHRCLQHEAEQGGLIWKRMVLPVTVGHRSLLNTVRRRLPGGGVGETVRPRGVFILVHDATQALAAKAELESKTALVREVHHRVKNNLQVIASITRMQARRATTEEARDLLEEAVNRILSVAVVHEFLSRNAKGTINLRELAARIVLQTERSLIEPGRKIRIRLDGPDIWLPAERVTQCALVINELLQNAIEHGMIGLDEGDVLIRLTDDGEQLVILVRDSGHGLPEGFDLEQDANLGLRIVRNMVERDLSGRFDLASDEAGTQALVTFKKSFAAGGD